MPLLKIFHRGGYLLSRNRSASSSGVIAFDTSKDRPGGNAGRSKLIAIQKGDLLERSELTGVTINSRGPNKDGRQTDTGANRCLDN